MKDVYDVGEMPPIGQVPKRMHAQVIRQDRFGVPKLRIDWRVCPEDTESIAAS